MKIKVPPTLFADVNEIAEVEMKEPYSGRFMQTMFGPISENSRAWFFVERFNPGTESYPHYHDPPAVEIFYGMKGKGIVETISPDQKIVRKYEVAPGQAVYSPEYWTHKIKNASDKEDWVVLCCVFEVPETE
jgi:oxalate decarboxylase/phosphoglucose isomerase-like protein (cupin superfamily)